MDFDIFGNRQEMEPLLCSLILPVFEDFLKVLKIGQ